MSKASLIVGNSNWAIKDSSLLGYNINDSNIYSPFPFDVTRASAATRVDKDGLIVTDEEIVSGELITNGDFSDGSTDWDASASGTSSVVFTDVATLNIDGSNSNVGIYQQNVFSSGKVYKVSVRMKASANFEVEVLESQGAVLVSSIATNIALTTSYQDFTFYHTAVGINDIFVHRLYSGSGANESITIDNVSVVEVNRNNLARIDYTDSDEGVLLTEPESTNLITDSEDFSDSSWGKPSSGTGLAPSVTENFAISPDGTQNADRVVFDIDGGTTSADFSQIQFIAGLKTGDYTNSVYMKSNTTESYEVVLANPPGDPTNHTVTTEWSRFDATSLGLSSQSTSLRIRLRGNESTSEYADISIWGAQLEQQSYATSYIPTFSSISTRNRDLVTNGGEVSTFNSEEGVLFAEIEALVDGGDNRYISISDGTTNNRIQLILNGSNANRITGGGSIFTSINYNSYNQTDMNKVALAYSALGVKLFVNGSLVASNTDNASFPTDSFTTLDLALWNQSSVPFYGKTKNLQVFKKALTDSELQILTTI